MIDSALLSAYVASRICHDLVSPVSSITNALDMIDSPTDPDMRQMAQDLLQDGAKSASVRLQFLRYAFGSVGLSGRAADIHEAKTITEAFVATHKPSVTWDIETDHLSFSPSTTTRLRRCTCSMDTAEPTRTPERTLG